MCASVRKLQRVPTRPVRYKHGTQLKLTEVTGIADKTHPEIVELNALSRGVVAAMAPMALSRNIDIAFEDAGTPVRVHGSRDALSRALRNLVENALQHAQGATFVRVSVDDEGCIFVTDNGAGIPESDRERIFERFRGRAGKESAGALLGLAIVKQTIEAHNGAVRVFDAPGQQGVSFSVALPLATVPPD